MALDQTTVRAAPDVTSERAFSPTPPRRRRGAMVLLGVALLAVALLALTLARSSSDSTRSDGNASLEVDDEDLLLDGGPLAPGEPGLGDGPETGQDLGGGGSTDDPEPGGEQPEGPGQPDGPGEPEPPVDPVPAMLQVSPDPVQLGQGVYSGSFSVANLGDQAMTWSATSKPSVTLSDTGGQLSGKSSTIVSFTVDKSTLSPGSFSFKIKVTGNGGTAYVDVHGVKPIDQLVNH